MKFWKKRDSSSARRTTRVWVLRAKKGILVMALTGAMIFAGFYAWQNGVFTAFGAFVHEKTLSITADAGFRVKQILVTGRQQIAQEDLLSRIDIREGAPIFGVSLSAAQLSLSEIPWVEEAAVSRRLPGTIVIHIRERRPVALWQYRQKISVIDASGQPLTSSSTAAWRHLPLVVGEDAPEHVTEIIELMQAEPDIAALLASATRTGNRRWDLQLKNGVLVKLPENNVGLALGQLALRQKEGLFRRGIATIDLRIPEKFVVEMKDPASEGKNRTEI